MDITKEKQEISPAGRSNRMADAYLIVCVAIFTTNMLAYAMTKVETTTEFVTGMLALMACNILAAFGGYRFHKAMTAQPKE